jgi:hypothetical protein
MGQNEITLILPSLSHHIIPYYNSPLTAVMNLTEKRGDTWYWNKCLSAHTR